MSYGMAVRGASGGLIIDEFFSGFYVDQVAPTYLSVGAGDAGIGFEAGNWYYWPLSGFTFSDLIFSQPASGDLIGGVVIGYVSLAQYLGSNLERKLRIRDNSNNFILKSFLDHPVSPSGYGLVVYGASGDMVYYSGANVARFEIVAFGEVTIVGGADVEILSGAGDISQYYCLANSVRQFSAGPPPAPQGQRYKYNFTSNKIFAYGQSGRFQYMIAKFSIA